MPHEIDGEPAYPIYGVGFKFHHAISDLERVTGYGPAWFEGLAAGRMGGGWSMDWVATEEMSDENDHRRSRAAQFGAVPRRSSRPRRLGGLG